MLRLKNQKICDIAYIIKKPLESKLVYSFLVLFTLIVSVASRAGVNRDFIHVRTGWLILGFYLSLFFSAAAARYAP